METAGRALFHQAMLLVMRLFHGKKLLTGLPFSIVIMTLYQRLKTLAASPKDPEREYVLSSRTYNDVYAMAADFQTRLFAPDTHTSVCLCTTDRAVTAAVLLAALTRPATVILPHTFSQSVIERIDMEHGLSGAILEDPLKLPENVKNVPAGRPPAFGKVLDASFIRDPGEVFVKLFTGGSSGAPRTWSKTIGNLFSEAIYHAEKMGITAEDKFVATVPPNHIYGLLFSVLTPLVAGAATIDGVLTYPHEIQSALAGQNATTLVSIPLHYKMLGAMDFSAPALTRALCSAARLYPEDSGAFHAKTGLGVTEIYGSTETGGIASRLCTKNQPHFTPLDCITWKLAESRLAIRSDFISPELPVDQDGFYVTSDQASVAGPNGFYLEGRADRIIKVAGKRVDLDEIRSVMMEMSQITDAFVLSVADAGGRGNEIRALAATRASAAQIRKHLTKQLPGHAMPRKIKTTREIPVSAAGKYDNAEIRKLLEA